MIDQYKLYKTDSKINKFSHDISETPQEIDTQERIVNNKIKQRNRKFDNPEIRKLCADNQKELSYCWTTDPARHKPVYDQGEVSELNHIWKKSAVRRVFDTKGYRKIKYSILLRVSTGVPVAWSPRESKFIDIEIVDKVKLHKLRKLLHEQDTRGYSE